MRAKGASSWTGSSRGGEDWSLEVEPTRLTAGLNNSCGREESRKIPRCLDKFRKNGNAIKMR
jgi:hypothetical protein